MVAFALALLVAGGAPKRTLALLVGVAVLWLVGTIDDRRPISAQVRVVFELAVVPCSYRLASGGTSAPAERSMLRLPAYGSWPS
jgi:UDP-N-acetylmuramyl pentapeptide phosphotransferase/UDP-N-acetylglucosamine-1-phosphate transferase